MDKPSRISVAPDGSIAVMARNAIHYFSASGKPLRSFPLPPTTKNRPLEFAYDGKWVVVLDYSDEAHDKVFLLDWSGVALRPSSLLAKARPRTQVPVLSPNGRELLYFDGLRTVTRYELPSTSERRRLINEALSRPVKK